MDRTFYLSMYGQICKKPSFFRTPCQSSAISLYCVLWFFCIYRLWMAYWFRRFRVSLHVLLSSSAMVTDRSTGYTTVTSAHRSIFRAILPVEVREVSSIFLLFQLLGSVYSTVEDSITSSCISLRLQRESI